ncbi:MAG TPA: lysophospholipid acyltransferase family protein [Oscillospiraceae bacterium]|nr:lysophospholipid acyltransferase family protein [Oscillospiraceae bacterium]HPK35631.1 lysophospholipid acyltransferase family protein [Oscillospiraceae bacterium]HPR74694.1 lysophospholipid acyltransferase family protein [Oscillospiraceae bacterium]
MGKDRSKTLKTHLPNRPLYAVLSAGATAFYARKAKIVCDNTAIKGMKPPFIAVCNHPSFFDWILMARALRPHRVNIIMTRYYYCYRGLAMLLDGLGAIPKDLFSPDPQTVRAAMTVIKKGGCIGIFPEGRLSPDGRIESFHSSIYKLMKNLGVPVINVHVEGSYFIRPKWSHQMRKGTVYVKAEPLFTAGELENIDEQTALERLEKALFYDESATQRIRRTQFRHPAIAEGLHRILYLCPKCGAEFAMKTAGGRIFCEKCGNAATLNAFYDLAAESAESVIPASIGDWYELQREFEFSRICRDPEVKMSGHVVLRQPRFGREPFSVVGEGVVTLDKNGLVYQGSRDGEAFLLEVPLNMLKALLYGAECDFEIYHRGQFYYFEPDNLLECVKWSVFGEQLYVYHILKKRDADATIGAAKRD